MTSLAQSVTTPQYNPYLEDPNAAAASASAYFPAQSAYSAPTQPVSCEIIKVGDWFTKFSSYNIIFMLAMVHGGVIYYHIKGWPMTSSSQMIFENWLISVTKRPYKLFQIHSYQQSIHITL